MNHPINTQPTMYFATGALADREVMSTLLGSNPVGHPMGIGDCTLGLVTGEEINSHLRSDMFPPDYKTRVLVNQTGASVVGKLYNLTPEQLEAVRMYTGEGVVTQAVELPLGDHEVTGHAEAHFLKGGLMWVELREEEREIFPNGREATLQSARETHRRWQESLHRHPGERR